MDRENWRRVEEAFHEAAALSEAERRRFLAELGAGDEALRAEVESLLEASSGDEDPIDAALEETLRQIAFDGTEQQRFGPYRVLGWLGGGSQSDVFLAERTDGEYRSRVAIKVAKRGFPNEELRLRFRQERQILASLRHANIARVLDGGTTRDGLPFFVMEHVDGEPIDSYCDRERLSIRERLRLFLSVCSAVEHAHRSLIIHRDLKPGNILVAGDRRPILLDFGIAKLLEEPAGEEEGVRTVEGLRFLTPAYASPEQVLGRPLTTATDVYSLGLVLYGLLCGSPAQEIEGLEPKALYEAICEGQPPPPSRTLRARGKSGGAGEGRELEIARARGETPGSLRQRLGGDLDNLVLTALRKEPERRYGSPAALAEDIEHYLGHRPIRARSDTLGYRFSKLLHRHPYGVAATTALLLAVLVGVLATARANRVARAERDQARISQSEAEVVTEFMVGLFEVSDPEVSLGEEVSAAELLELGAEGITGELADQPSIRARLLRAMGRSYHGLGLYSRAEELFARAVSDREKVSGPSDASVAEDLLALARSILAGGDYARAEEVVRRALEIYTGGGPAHELGKASSLDLLAELRLLQQDLEQAETLYRRALELRTRRLGPEHLDTLASLADLAETLQHGHRLEEARELFERVLTHQRRQLPGTHPEIMKTLNNIAVAQQSMGDLEGAERTMREVVAARRRLYGESHPHVALAYNNLGQILSTRGAHTEAVEWTERALTLSKELYEEGHRKTADILYSHGVVLEKGGRFEQAEERLTESLALRRRIYGEESAEAAQSLLALSTLHARTGDRQRSMEEARESLRILDAAGSSWRSSPLLQLGLLLAEVGRCSEARPLFEEALALRRAHLPEGHPSLSSAEAAAESCR